MRGLLLALLGFAFLPVIVYAPFTGVLVYEWYQYMAPDRISWGLIQTIPFSMLFATAAIGGWFLFEPKRSPGLQLLAVIMFLLFVWTCITTYHAVLPAEAMWKWERTAKVMAFSFLAMLVLTERVRIEAFIWVFVLSVGYYGVHGTYVTLRTGGGEHRVMGAPTSFLGDNNMFAVAALMAIPMAIHLLRYGTIMPRTRWVRLGVIGLASMLAVSVLGTHSRGALVAAVPVLGWYLLKSRKKAITIAIVGFITTAVLTAAPESWFERMSTIGTYEQDTSAMHRIESWQWAMGVAEQHPVYGGGFRIFLTHIIDERGHWLEAHNIYFEVLAEQGYVGLTLFVLVLVGSYRNLGRVARGAQGQPEAAWMVDLARTLQLSLVAYAVGGAFLSIAFHPMLYDIAALSVALRGHLLPRLRGMPQGTAAPPAARQREPA